MGEAKRLQVVDMNQFTKLINLLQKKESDAKIICDVEMPAKKLELLDSHEQMKNSVKNKSLSANNDIIQFMRKKRKYQETVGSAAQVAEGANAEGGEGGEGGVVGVGRGSQVVRVEKRIKDFLTTKKIVKNRKGTLSYKGEDIGVNYEDLLDDLAHDYKKSEPNLSKPAMRKALSVLKKEAMPVSYIKNKKIKAEYKKIIDPSDSSDSDFMPSTLFDGPSTSVLRVAGPPSASRIPIRARRQGYKSQ